MTLQVLKGALESKGPRINAKKSKMVISSEIAGKVTTESRFNLLFAERMQAVMLSFTIFAFVGCIRK